MLKIEYVWRELLYRAIELNQPNFTITELANRFHLSSSMVSHALLPLRGLNIVKIGKIKSTVVDTERLLYFWATRRNLNKEIIYQTYSKVPVSEREATLPAKVIPTAYSACRLLFQTTPADYDKIYFYSTDLLSIKKRFPQVNNRSPNLLILKPDPFLFLYRQIPLAQIFVDLWNLPVWYAGEFIRAIKLIIKEKIGL